MSLALTALLTVTFLILTGPVLAGVFYRRNVLPILTRTYVFWASLSLLNFWFLAPLAFPPLLLLKLSYGKFVEFLLLPIAISSAALAVSLALVRWRIPKYLDLQSTKGWATFIFNGLFLVVFLLVADVYKNHLISKDLRARKPECVQINSFYSSVLNAGEEYQFHAHAFFTENGRNFYWSYSKRKFFPGNEGLDKNFSCKVMKREMLTK